MRMVLKPPFFEGDDLYMDGQNMGGTNKLLIGHASKHREWFGDRTNPEDPPAMGYTNRKGSSIKDLARCAARGPAARKEAISIQPNE
jgi:hypothetical protein